jgi:hypothetical protein
MVSPELVVSPELAAELVPELGMVSPELRSWVWCPRNWSPELGNWLRCPRNWIG